MNDELSGEARPVVSGWLRKGPDRAPADLLTRSIERTRSSPQRPAWLAAALRAPALEPAPKLGVPFWIWIAVAGAALALLAGVAAAGMHDSNQLVVVPSRSMLTKPAPIETAPFLASAGPAVPLLFYSQVGTWFAADVADPWTGVRYLEPPDPQFKLSGRRMLFTFDPCRAQPNCAESSAFLVTVGTLDEGLVYGWGECPDTVPAHSLQCGIYKAETGGFVLVVKAPTTDALAAAWMKQFGQAVARTIGFRDAQWVILRYPSRWVALIVHGDSLVAVSAEDGAAFLQQGPDVRFQRMVAGVHFADESPTTAPPN